MDKTKLNRRGVQLAAALAQGYAVIHGQYAFEEGKSVRKSGVVNTHDIKIVVTTALFEQLEAAAVPLETYMHSEAQGWKTIVPMNKRNEVAAALSAS